MVPASGEVSIKNKRIKYLFLMLHFRFIEKQHLAMSDLCVKVCQYLLISLHINEFAIRLYYLT